MASQYNTVSSTTNIFYHDANYACYLRNLRLWPNLPPLNLIGSIHTPPIISSSCLGFVACRCSVTGRYYFGNPYNNLGFAPLPYPPSFHHPHDTRVVLTIDPSSSLILLICAVRTDNAYIFHAYNSHYHSWYSFQPSESHQSHGSIMPNSGVGIGKAAFWILEGSAQFPTSVLRCYTGGDWMASRFWYIPPPHPGQPRLMQLGRTLGKLGLVIVHAGSSTVELFTLQPDLGNPMWQIQEKFNVEISDRVATASWRQEDMTMVCREMPRPIRFDGAFNVELLFWVQGRVLRLENTAYGRREYRLTVFANQDLPASIIHGVPHVGNFFS